MVFRTRGNCINKVKCIYFDRSEAKKAAECMEALHPGIRFKAYFCNHCNAWHVGGKKWASAYGY